MAAPTLVAFTTAQASVATGVNVTTASVSWQTSDVVVVMGTTEGGVGGETLTTPTTTGSGISFGAAQKIHNSTGSDSGVGCWAAVASAGSSGTFSVNATNTGGSNRFVSLGVYVFRGSAGIGNSVLYTGVSPTGASLTPTAADGSIVWALVDWAAAATTTPTPTATSHNASTPGPSATPVAIQNSGTYTYYFADLDDQTSAGAVSYGITGSGTGPFGIIAFEAKASSGTNATVIPPARVDVLIA